MPTIEESPYSTLESRKQQIEKIENIALFRFWGLSVIFLTVLSFIVFWTLETGIAIMLCAAFWGSLFGFTGLIYLPPKVVTAVFGIITGATGTSAVTGAGLISSMRNTVVSITNEIMISVDGIGVDPALEWRVQIAVWIFIALLVVFLLPAFIADEKK